VLSDIIANQSGETISTAASGTAQKSLSPSSKTEQTASTSAPSIGSNASSNGDVHLVTNRFQHVITDGGHAVITGRGGETLQRCEDEPIHIPGAIQGFGLLIALREEADEALVVRIVSENSKRIIGRSPQELFALESFTDILSEEQADNLLDHIDFIKEEDADVATNGPEVFTMSIKVPGERSRKLWCAIHQSDRNPGLIICEFELEDDPLFPLVPPEEEHTPERPEDTLSSEPTEAEFIESTETTSKPLRILRSARKRRGEAAAMEVFNIMSQVQEQLAAASNLERFLKVLVGVVKELTGFHRVMIYQFDQAFNGRVVTELVDPRATKDLYQGLKFPATDIPKQARDLYKLNRVRMLYDRDQETARLVCRTAQDIEQPLDLSYSYLRAMSPIHLKYLANMAVRSSMSISINAFNELWGLISCHTYGTRGMRVSFPIRKMCRLVGDAASRNIERLSYASRLQARKLINTAPTQKSPSGYIVASSEDLLKLFNADFGLLSIHDETKILGRLEQASQEALAMLEYLRLRNITSVLTSQDVTQDFPDLRYPPGFQIIAGMLIVPLSAAGRDFIVFFRKGQLKEVKWAGNPYEKYIREGTEGYLEPRTSFKIWRETVVGKSREWTEEEVETAAVLCLVYGKFIDVWRQKEAALQNSQLTRLLLANSAHEVRTPLNAIINYLEIALEGTLDQEIRDNLTKSHSASKSLIYVINDLLDLTKTEEGGSLIKGETFDLRATLKEATDMFAGDAKRKNLTYEVIEYPGLPQECIGDQGRVRQAISNITANAIKNTAEGSVTVEVYVVSRPSKEHIEVEIAVTDTGSGMSAEKLDQLFNELEQAETEQISLFEDAIYAKERSPSEQKGALGLGLAIVSRIIRNMNGQLRLKSEEGKGSRFVILFPFDLPESDIQNTDSIETSEGSLTPVPQQPGERTLVAPSTSRNNSLDSARSGKRGSPESLNRKTGQNNTLHSFNSGASHRSDVDRLIEAIQVPHRLDDAGKDGASSTKSMRPMLTTRQSSGPRPTSPALVCSKSLTMDDRRNIPPPHRRSVDSTTAGQKELPCQSTPLKPVKMPDDPDSHVSPEPMTGIIGEVEEDSKSPSQQAEPLSAEHMRVLVAEDDPVNSRIIKKRLEKLGHSVTLTVNGEECAGTFIDKPQDFDVVLMDMQVC
jgi:light-regulated signal transduction histidine kinase (bacteriophytochrome)